MIIRINTSCLFLSILAAGFFAGCSSTTPPPLPAGNAADSQARVSENRPNNLLVHDETTVAIQKELSQTASNAKSAETMHHDMNNMPGMKMDDHKEMPSQTNVGTEEKAVSDEMKKTSEEMKKISEEMKQKSQQSSSQNFYYTCRMHPQIHSDKPGKCPICGMTLIKKEGVPPK